MSASSSDPSAQTGASSSSSQSKANFVAAAKDGARSFGRRIRDAFTSPKDLSMHGDQPPAYGSYPASGLAAAPQVAIDYSYMLNPRMSYRIAETGVDKPVSTAQGHPNLVMGPDRHTITFRERTTLVDKHLSELDHLTSAAPAGGYPPHSVESFKTAQLVKTIGVLSDVKIPTHASKQYMEKIQGLIAIHERMAEMEKTLAAAEEGNTSGKPWQGGSTQK